MESNVSFLIVALGYLAFGIWAAVWISRKKKAGKKISTVAKIIIAAGFLSSSSVLIAMIVAPPGPETDVSGAGTFYVKTGSANVRECPSTSCKIIDSLAQNTPLTFPGNLFDKYPDWAEVTFPNGEIGYVSKTTLSENPVSKRQLTPTDDSSSVGGVTIGPWNNIQTTLGESYELHFCEPSSAISGATCGGLADKATDPKGGTPPYSFIKKSGFLPPGIVLELNGTLRGTPTQIGTYNFRLCAKDLYGGEGCQNLAVFVGKARTAPLNEDTAGSVDITINSITCVLAYQDDYGRLVFDVSLSGTARGPIGTYFSSGSSALDERYTPAELGSNLANISAEVKTNSWTGESRDTRDSSNIRVQGDPVETSWEMRGRAVHLYGEKSTMTRVNLSLYGGGPNKKIFKDVMCSS